MNGKVYELRFDGSCWPNPGPKAGFGWVVFIHDPEEHDDPVIIAQGNGPVPLLEDGRTTNNVGEWHALFEGLRWFRHVRMPVEKLVIRGDSLMVIEQVNRVRACRKPHLTAYLKRCHDILDGLEYPWEAFWVPRAENAVADELSGIYGDKSPYW